MKPGLNTIRSGMSPSHQQAIQNIADKYNYVIGICPTNEKAWFWINEYHCPGKPSSVKGINSGEKDFAAGLFLINPDLRGDISHEGYAEYRNRIMTALNTDRDLKAIPCALPEKRLHELTDILGDQLHLEFSADKQQCNITIKNEIKTIQVTGQQNSETQEYTIYDQHGELVEVIGMEVINAKGVEMLKPVTSDYDLLVVCPAYEELDLGGKDKTPFSTQGQLQHIHAIIKASTSPFYLCPKEDPQLGNVSTRMREVIQLLNAEIAKLDHNRNGINLEMFRHNAAYYNPFAAEPDKLIPCEIFIPAPQPQSKVLLAQSFAELRAIIKLIAEKYYWPSHSLLDARVLRE